MKQVLNNNLNIFSGGNGTSNSINASSVTYAGGGGGATIQFFGPGPFQPGPGGSGGAGNGSTPSVSSTAGTANTGGGGGGFGSAGGSGIVIIRYKYQN